MTREMPRMKADKLTVEIKQGDTLYQFGESTKEGQCFSCGKPFGYKGYRGPECQCGKALGHAAKGSHRVG